MDWIGDLLDRFGDHQAILWWLFAASVTVFLLTPIAVGWIVVRLPADYFAQPRRQRSAWWDKYPSIRSLILVVKNLIGVLLLIAGLAMLVAPGQGLLTIAVGIVLMDFPGKYRLQRWLVTRKPIWRTINWLRRRAGRVKFDLPK